MVAKLGVETAQRRRGRGGLRNGLAREEAALEPRHLAARKLKTRPRFPYVIIKVALSLRGRGGSFSFCCLPSLCTLKITGICKFSELLIAFEQIPAIPATFREIFGEKQAICACSKKKLAKSGKIAEISTK